MSSHHSRAVERVRPKMMAVIAIMAGLLQITWSGGIVPSRAAQGRQ
jgi:Cu/Ag efflux pump CusA